MAIDGGVVLRHVPHRGQQPGRRPEIRRRLGRAQDLAVAVEGIGLGELRHGLALALELASPSTAQVFVSSTTSGPGTLSRIASGSRNVSTNSARSGFPDFFSRMIFRCSKRSGL